MAMKVPGGGNPFAVNVATQSTQEMGLVDAPKTAFSEAALADRLKTAGDKIEAQAQKWVDEQDRARLQKFANDLSDLQSDLEANPETGFLNLQGENASNPADGKDLRTNVTEQFDQRSAVLMEKMGWRTRARANELRDAMRSRLNDKVNRHIIQQAAVAKQAENARTIDIAMKNLQAAETPEDVYSNLFVLRGLTDEQAREKGVPADYSKTMGVAHSLLIGDMVEDKRFDDAKGWLEGCMGDMSADQYKKAKDLIDAGVKLEKGKTIGDELYEKHKDDKAGGIKALLGVDEEYREIARKQLTFRRKEADQIKAAELAELKKQVYTFIAKDENVPLGLKQELLERDPEMYRTIEKLEESRMTGQPIQTDLPTFDKLNEMAQTNPQAFRELNMVEYKGKLSNGDIAHFQTLQKNLPGNQYKAWQTQVKARMKMEKKVIGGKEHLVTSAALAMWNEEVGKSKNNVVDPKRMSEMLVELFDEVSVPGRFFGTNEQPRWEVISERPNMSASDAVLSATHGVTMPELRQSMKSAGLQEPKQWNDETIGIASALALNKALPKKFADAVEKFKKAPSKQVPGKTNEQVWIENRLRRNPNGDKHFNSEDRRQLSIKLFNTQVNK